MEETTELINFSSNFGSGITHTAPDALKKYEKKKFSRGEFKVVRLALS